MLCTRCGDSLPSNARRVRTRAELQAEAPRLPQNGARRNLPLPSPLSTSLGSGHEACPGSSSSAPARTQTGWATCLEDRKEMWPWCSSVSELTTVCTNCCPPAFPGTHGEKEPSPSSGTQRFPSSSPGGPTGCQGRGRGGGGGAGPARLYRCRRRLGVGFRQERKRASPSPECAPKKRKRKQSDWDRSHVCF